ncbi:PilT/PilU family type 4a pilus ATPase [bacterium]|nr:PilT/PilU family type 4a pilus ATPase [candidate division CSSED10-310 bacterium]
MVRQNLGNWKKKYQPVITTDSWSTDEERQAFVKQLKERRRFPRKEILEVLSNVYTITNHDKKLDIMDVISQMFRDARDSYVPDELLDLFRTTPDPEIRNWIVRILPDISNDALIPSLMPLFRHTNPLFRKAALTLLEQFNIDVVAEILAAELVVGTWHRRSEPLRFLNEIAPDKVIDPCRQALIIGDEEDRMTAVSILAEVRTEEALKILAESSDDDSDAVRSLLTSEIGRIPGELSVQTLIRLTEDRKCFVVVKALEGLKRLGDETCLPAVIRCAGHEDVRVRAAGLATLGEIGTVEQLDLLISGIKHPDIRIRQAAQGALIHLSASAESKKRIADLMQDDDVNVRRAVAQILGEIDAPKLFEKIFDYLQDPDWWVRDTVINALSKMKDPGVFAAAIELLNHPDPSLKRYAIDILVNIGNALAVKPIIQLLKDQEESVRIQAVSGLGKLGDAGVVSILAELLSIPDLAYSAAEAMGNIGHPSAIRPLIEHLPNADTQARLLIMNALEKLHATESISTLKTYLADTNRDVQIRAKEVLSRLQVIGQSRTDDDDEWWMKQQFSILDTMLMQARSRNVSDLFLVSGNPALIRRDGDMIPISEEIISEDQILSMIHGILSPVQEQRFHAGFDLDFSHEIPRGGRYRGNLLRHSNGINMVFRVLPEEIPSLNDLHIPEFVGTLTTGHGGLILVTGPAMSGKTSTVAALINRINETRTKNIITIEDPVEFVHEHRNSLIIQREIGRHATSFPHALQNALREDPDIIMISDLQDPDTLVMALSAAEKGHLVMGSMDSISASQTIERIINLFPERRRDQVRISLSESLKAIISQQLIPRSDGESTVVAMEILVNTPAVAALIRDDKLFQIPSMISTGTQHGMVSMDQALVKLVRQDLITEEDAYARAFDKNQFESQMREMVE